MSRETIYKAFTGKAGLLKAVYDVTLAGDAEPIPMRDRPEFRALRSAARAEEAASAYSDIAAVIGDRVGALLEIVYSASGADPEVARFLRQIDDERLTGARMVCNAWADSGWLRPDLSPERAVDIVWALNSPTMRGLLLQRGWTTRDYSAWLRHTLLSTVLTPTA